MREYIIGGYNIKQIQSVMLEIMVEIDRICRKNNIHYILDGGTMLGAIRHGGFIPWDDDLDVAMLREDYDKFVQACKTDLSNEYFLQTNSAEEEYPYDFAKLKKNNTLYVESGMAYLNVHKGVYVDIFPIDNVYENTYRLQGKVLSLIRRARWRKIQKKTLPMEKRKAYLKTSKTRVAAPLTAFSIKTINGMAEKVMRLNNEKETELVYKVCHPNKVKPPYERSIYTDVIEYPFEGKMFYIPREYDRFLTERYGDYMKWPPEDKQVPSHGILEVKL